MKQSYDPIFTPVPVSRTERLYYLDATGIFAFVTRPFRCRHLEFRRGLKREVFMRAKVFRWLTNILATISTFSQNIRMDFSCCTLLKQRYNGDGPDFFTICFH